MKSTGDEQAFTWNDHPAWLANLAFTAGPVKAKGWALVAEDGDPLALQPGHHAPQGAPTQLFHHLLHLQELLHQAVDVLDLDPRPLGDPAPPQAALIAVDIADAETVPFQEAGKLRVL